MRLLPLFAAGLAVIVIIWEIPVMMFSHTTIWPVLMLLAVGIILLSVDRLLKR